MMENLTTILLKIPRNSEVTPESAQTFLAALTQINSVSNLDRLLGRKPQVLSLEIALFNRKIFFQITTEKELAPFVEAQIQSNYPLVLIEPIVDPVTQMGELYTESLGLSKGNYHPIITYPSFQDVDPLASILSVLSKADQDENAIVQLSLEAIGGYWQSSGHKMIERGIVEKSADGTTKRSSLPDEAIIKEKISYPGFAVAIRIAAGKKHTLNALKSAFGVYNRPDGNSFTVKSFPLFTRRDTINEIKSRVVRYGDILNIHEIATLWHLPGEKVKTASIVWGNAVLSEAPDNLPAAMDMDAAERQTVNFFAKTYYKNTDAAFGIRDRDRGRHIWVVGKTGTGKSTLIANMVIDDIKKGRGVGVIDPHGDLVETVLDYIPSNRINETIYFNPADKEYPVVLNPLEVRNKEEAELSVSGLMSVFTKIWANTWSARMEYMLRNSLMTLTEVEDATFADVLTLFSDSGYRNYVVNQIKDESLKQYWLTEYNQLPDRYVKEAIAPIQNKVGQFITSPMIRRIIGKPKSTIDLKEIMDSGKIFLANLSQGRLGEDNATLLGAMLITKFQLAAMNRVDIPEDDRVPFNLFVDEFQNFATESFIKILSEARKYKLNLMLANQYMAQIPEEVLKAILGNVGSLVSFRIGAEDASIIHKEFGEVFTENDLVNLANFRIATRLMIDNHSSRPFLAGTLPLPASRNSNREKVIKISRERWAKKHDELEEKQVYEKIQEKINQGKKDNRNNQNQNNNYRNDGPKPFQKNNYKQNQNQSQKQKPTQTHKPFANVFANIKKQDFDSNKKPDTQKTEKSEKEIFSAKK